MEPKYVVAYEHGDCSGGVLYVRSGDNAKTAGSSACTNSIAITTKGVSPTAYIPLEEYMDLVWDDTIGVTERVIQNTCVYTGPDHGFLLADCWADPHTYSYYQDSNCRERIESEKEPHSITCVIPNAYMAQFNTNHGATIPPKYIKKYQHNDCTGALLFYDDFTGDTAANQEVAPCKDGFELTETAPTPDQFVADHVYMNVSNPYLLFSGTVLDQTCVAYQPHKYVVVNCTSQSMAFFTDDVCASPDHQVLYPRNVWGVHCSVLNPNFVLDVACLSTIILVILVGGGGAVAFVLWRRGQQATLSHGEYESLLKDLSCDADEDNVD
ncbi:Aste57867_21775 [Aphanomyces stellatus]|uniref:Aste57867_21775 protein n=1 Tax=Aphanomyces stellatus TaxID=120398 RepID=A0A485LJM9_9STRA|nr:hypothetical protein As57867_021706 [Aphanomyces stellatus]VFT98444.1 Aste57867_21775 [Aphanomyces stellatus]